jgi:O-antigen/teichoic acid export membrane protein
LDKKQEIKDLFLKSSRYLGMLIACIYTPFIVFGPRFLYLWVGKEVAENTATVFILLLFATILSTLFALMINSYLVATGKLNLYTKYTLFRAILLAISLICFLRLIGLNGAGWAMIICGLLDVFFYFFVVIKYVKFNPLFLFSGIYLKLGIISLISGLIIKFFYLTHIYSWATLVIGASLYLIISLFLCFVFRVFNDEEKAMFNAVTSRLFGF